ncbi:MAG: T9SS type A sorting domain-containing protein, partial [Bergeyella sp.]
NSATTYGGGMYNSSSSPTITNSSFTNNTADNGGGMCNASSLPSVTNSRFTDNSATTYGGGMYNSSSSPTITNSSFTNNTASSGGGMANYSSSPSVTNIRFTDNSATSNGGGIYNNSGNGIFTNVTMANNGSTGFYAYGWTYWKNSIIWDAITGSNYSAEYSLIEGNTATTNGNIDATGITVTDIFNDATNGDYTLKSSSVAINAGNNALNSTTTDLAGNVRIYDTVIDLGAYEYLGGTLSAVSVLKDKLLVYPNPFTDILKISDIKNVVSISVSDMSGRLVKQMIPSSELNLSQLYQGSYLVVLTMKDGSKQTVKVIKK